MERQRRVGVASVPVLPGQREAGGGEAFVSNERECDSPFTSLLNVCIQEVQHLVHAARRHGEDTQAIITSSYYRRPLADPTST